MQRPWRTCSPWLAQPAFLDKPRATLLRGGVTHSELDPRMSVIRWPMVMPTGPFDGGKSSVKTPSSLCPLGTNQERATGEVAENARYRASLGERPSRSWGPASCLCSAFWISWAELLASWSILYHDVLPHYRPHSNAQGPETSSAVNQNKPSLFSVSCLKCFVTVMESWHRDTVITETDRQILMHHLFIFFHM